MTTLKALLDGLEIPIVQAPMLGACDAALALAANRAGGLGSLPAAGLSPAEVGPAVDALREATDRPFVVNLLMAPKAEPAAEDLDDAIQTLRPWYAELGEPLPESPNQFAPNFEAQLEALTVAAPPIASFTFDILRREQVEALQKAGVLVVGTANTVAEARAWADVGADGICAQGAEAGGHHGYFLADIEDSLIGTLALVATIRAAVNLPVIAAGGIMDGRGVAAALALGADAAQMGTAFLLSDEATVSAPWKDALQSAGDDATRLTRAFTGRYARGLENRFMREMREGERDVPAYPVQNRLTQPLRAAATRDGKAEMISLWAGQGAKLIESGGAETLMRRWWDEARDAARSLARRTKV
jgi:nitronate monooxygenase